MAVFLLLREPCLVQVRKPRLTYSRHALAATHHQMCHGLLARMDATTTQQLKELELAYQGGPAEQQWPHGTPAVRPLGPALGVHDETQVLGPPKRAAWGKGAKGLRAPRINGPPPRLSGRCVTLLWISCRDFAVARGHVMEFGVRHCLAPACERSTRAAGMRLSSPWCVPFKIVALASRRVADMLPASFLYCLVGCWISESGSARPCIMAVGSFLMLLWLLRFDEPGNLPCLTAAAKSYLRAELPNSLHLSIC